MPDVERMEPATIGSPKKPTHTLMVLLGIGAIIILAVLLYNTLFSNAFWQSRELEQNRAKWESRHITHYRMSLDSLGYSYEFDRMPLTVEVRDDQIVSVVDAQGQGISPGKKNPFYLDYPQAFTVPGLFTLAQDWIWQKPPMVDVSYDPALGYPDSIDIDPYTEPCCQELFYTVSDLQVLPP